MRKKTANFFVESLKNMKTIGALTACSPAAAGKMTKPVDFSRAMLVVELGGGTGAITKEILARMRPDAELVVFEINPVFADVLSVMGDQRLTVVNDSAVNLGRYLSERGITTVDAVISTLPLTIMDKETRAAILGEVLGVLHAEGRYVQIQYSLVSKKEMQRKFSSVKLDFTPLNFPPAFFYICER